MSSSSSDSDSNDYEPMRRIKINIKPLDDTAKKGAADTNEIKASVKAWRPLGPPVHSSLSRRQLSLSSVSSMPINASLSSYTNNIATTNNLLFDSNGPKVASSNKSRDIHAPYSGSVTRGRIGGIGGGGGGTSIHSSPSCSSLVNEFNNRSSFSSIMPNISRTSSPLTLSNLSDQSVPIAIAIQESIELTVKSHFTHEPIPVDGPNFTSCRLGNIKIAFPNAFAKGASGKPGTVLRLRLHPIVNIVRFYASRLLKDLEVTDNSKDNKYEGESASSSSFNCLEKQTITNAFNTNNLYNNNNINDKRDTQLLDGFSSSSQSNQLKNLNNSSKSVELHKDLLIGCLKKMYDQNPTSSYYNIDVLRYQIAPIASIDESPLQVCAYWKVESNLIKVRIDFKHSSKSGLNLERLREVTFTVDFTNFIPHGLKINSTKFSNNNNNNNLSAMNMNNLSHSSSLIKNFQPNTGTLSNSYKTSSLIDHIGVLYQQSAASSNVKEYLQDLTATTSKPQLVNNGTSSNFSSTFYGNLPDSVTSSNGRCKEQQQMTFRNTDTIGSPNITYEPAAHWNENTKQLIWKFDTLLPYHKTNGFGSLFAKFDLRNQQSTISSSTTEFRLECTPKPVDVKFLIIDSTMSKMNITTESVGYKMSLLKREIRSAIYKSEPYIVL